MKKMIDVAVIVSSCDHFQSVLPPFCHGFHKYWPKCPWPLRFIMNFADAPCGETVKMGDDGGVKGWSNASRRALETMSEPVVLWMHDDNWISQPVDTRVIAGLVSLFERRDLHLVRLSGCSASAAFREAYRHDERLKVIRPDARQRCSLQPSLWRRSTLVEMLVDGESPWWFEGMAPHRSREVKGDFLCCKEGFNPLRFMSHIDPDWSEEAVRRGKWTKSAAVYAEREGIDVDFSIHPDGSENTEMQVDSGIRSDEDESTEVSPEGK